MSRTIRLYPSQAAHVDALDGILDRSHYAFDTSVMGSGKTFAGTGVFLKRGFRHLMVVAPLTVLPAWEKVLHDHDIRHAKLYTYDSLSGKKGKTELKHGYLTRTDVEQVLDNDRVREVTYFAATPLLKQHADEGLLFVFDEIQHLKNVESQRAKAARAIVDIIEERFVRGGRSRVLLLSGSPVDREHQCTNLLMLLNVTRHDYLMYNKERLGVSDIIAYCRRLDAAATQGIVNGRVLNSPGACETLVYRLFQDVIKPAMSHVMPNPGIPHTLYKFNGHFVAHDDDDLDELDAGIEALQKAVGGRFLRGQGGNRNLVGQLGAALCQIEKGKLNLLARLADLTLRGHPTVKVVVAVNCLDTIDRLVVQLGAYEPLVLRGDVHIKDRRIALDKFQTHDDRHRLVVGNTLVLSTGIGLHDTHGDFPRICFVSPTYRTIDLYQLGHRFWRRGVRSDAQLYMVYVKDHTEDRILAAEMRKGGVMREVTEEQVEAGQVFPGQYPIYEEEDDDEPRGVDIAPAARAPADFTAKEAQRIQGIDPADETPVECVYGDDDSLEVDSDDISVHSVDSVNSDDISVHSVDSVNSDDISVHSV